MNNTSANFQFRTTLREARDRRARRSGKADADFLAKIAAQTIAERLGAVNRTFQNRSDVMSRFDAMQDTLEAMPGGKKVCRIGGYSPTGKTIPWDPNSEPLPLQPASQDLITSVYGLHRTNDLSSLLFQIRHALKPDGLFMAAMPGPQTLQELRQSFIEAETEVTGGAAMRVDPFGTIQQFGGLLQQCGFALPVVDNENLTVRYASMHDLIRDLRSMGSTLTLKNKAPALTRSTFVRAAQIYSEKHSDADGRIRATFECIYLSGWAPHSSQQKPLKPGSATKSLSEALSPKNLK